MRKPNLWRRFAALAGMCLLVAADQYLKRLAAGRLQRGQARVLLPGVLALQYTENTGISFSLFGNSTAAMRVVTAVTALVLLAGMAAVLAGKIGRGAPLCGAALILAGGLGNLIDRAARGYVVDYVEFLFVRFAVFNFADICISCGVILLGVWVIWSEAFRRKTAAMP